MSSVYISQADQIKLKAISTDLPQGLMISGYQGVGLGEVLDEIENLIGSSYQVQTLSLTPEEGKKTVSITQVRELYGKTKTGRSGDQILLVKLNDIELLGVEAQNALLKILEEPPKGVHFLIGANHDQAGLETIRSRTIKFKLQQPSQDEIFIKFSEDEAQLNKKWMLSGGRINQFRKLVNQDIEAEIKLNDAKLFATTNSGLKKTELAIKYADSAENLHSFAEDVMGVLKSLFQFFLEQGQIDKSKLISEKIVKLNDLLIESGRLNLNKRILMIMLLRAV